MALQENNINRNIIAPRKEEKAGLTFAGLLHIFQKYWGLFIGCIMVMCLIAFLYLRYSTPSYKVNASLLVQDDKKGGNMPDGQMLQDMGFLGAKSNVDNEVEILKSRTLMERVANDLQLNVQYFGSGRIKVSEFYKNLPFRFRILSLKEDAIPRKCIYAIKLKGNNGFELSYGNKKWAGRLNDSLQLPIGTVAIEGTSLSSANLPREYKIRLSKHDDVVTKYMHDLNVAVANKQVSVIDLTLNEELPAKGEDILNKLLEVYMKANVEDKSRIADSTMSFIDERLALVGVELSGIEHQIENFKKTNELTDLSEQSKMLLNNTSDYVKQLTQQEVQLSVVNSLDQYLQNSVNNTKIVPASLVIQDPTFTGLISKYNNLQMERERLLMSNTESNPVVQNMDQQLAGLKGDLTNSMYSLKRELKIGINGLRNRTGGLDAQIRKVPGIERVYLEYSRQQNIKQELYLFLLKKREETAITKSSTIANARIVDAAKSDKMPFKPRGSLIMLSAMLLGIMIPGGGIYLKGLLNTRIHAKADILEETGMPILAEIGNNDSGTTIVVEKGSRTQLSEQFRSLRTNIQFLLRGGQDKVVLVTSSIAGEGKSFVSMNLACAIALTGKRVVFVEMDLRKSNIYDQINLNYGTGFSNYAIGMATLNEIVQPSGILDNLFIVPSGPIPPNPSELLMSEQVTDFFAILRDQFDYIIVDTAPLGLVTDAQLLADHANVCLYLVRQGYTFKHQLLQVEELYQSGKLPKIHMVVNDVKTGNDYYGYKGKYGYYENYYTDQSPRKQSSGKKLIKSLTGQS